MNTEVAINLQGVIVSVSDTPLVLTFEKGEQFKQGLTSTLGVVAEDGTHMTSGEHRRKEMHDKLDNWIDGVEHES
jgi:hypothetical protein